MLSVGEFTGTGNRISNCHGPHFNCRFDWPWIWLLSEDPKTPYVSNDGPYLLWDILGVSNAVFYSNRGSI
jgi:hypothetical protein